MVDLASHRPCVTDLLVYSPTGHSRGAEPRYAPPGVWTLHLVQCHNISVLKLFDNFFCSKKWDIF